MNKLKNVLEEYIQSINMGSKNSQSLKNSLHRIRKRSTAIMYLCIALIVLVFSFSFYLSIELEDSNVFVKIVTADAGLLLLFGSIFYNSLREANGADYLLAIIENVSEIQITEIIKALLTGYFRSVTL